jgi:hypothetical protein
VIVGFCFSLSHTPDLAHRVDILRLLADAIMQQKKLTQIEALEQTNEVRRREPRRLSCVWNAEPRPTAAAASPSRPLLFTLFDEKS